MKKQLSIIGAAFTAAAVISAAGSFVYKKIKEKQAEKNKQDYVPLLEHVEGNADQELAKAELAAEDQIKSENSEFPEIPLDENRE